MPQAAEALPDDEVQPRISVEPAPRKDGIYYKAPPTISAFMTDVREGFNFKIIMGPFGSGKTSGSVCHIPQLAAMQPPDHDGVRRTRFLLIRSTYVQLRDTTIKTFLDWIRPHELKLGVYYSSKKSVTLLIGTGWGRMEIECMFFALDKLEDEANLKSLEFTWAFLNEASEINFDLISTLRKRTGRYPSKKNGPGALHYGIFGDTNPPDEGSQWWSAMENFDPESFGVPLPESERYITVYKQPSGQSPEAENIENMPDRGYYFDTRGMTEDDIRTKIHGRYGRGRFGRPVIGGFDPAVHVAKNPFGAVEGIPIVAGMDCALTPSVVFFQTVAFGKVLVIGEVMGFNMGSERFCKTLLRPYVYQMGWGRHSISFFYDPSGNARAQTDERVISDVMRENGFVSGPAKTQNIELRIRAAERLLTSFLDGKPGFVIDPRCSRLIAALRGGYRFHAEKLGEIVKLKEEPHSHIADAFMYGALHLGDGFNSPVRAPVRIVPVSMRAWTG